MDETGITKSPRYVLLLRVYRIISFNTTVLLGVFALFYFPWIDSSMVLFLPIWAVSLSTVIEIASAIESLDNYGCDWFKYHNMYVFSCIYDYNNSLSEMYGFIQGLNTITNHSKYICLIIKSVTPKTMVLLMLN